MTFRSREKRLMAYGEALFIKRTQRGTNIFKGKLGTSM